MERRLARLGAAYLVIASLGMEACEALSSPPLAPESTPYSERERSPEEKLVRGFVAAAIRRDKEAMRLFIAPEKRDKRFVSVFLDEVVKNLRGCDLNQPTAFSLSTRWDNRKTSVTTAYLDLQKECGGSQSIKLILDRRSSGESFIFPGLQTSRPRTQ